MDNRDLYEIVWAVSKAAALAIARKYSDMSSLREKNSSIRNKSLEEMVTTSLWSNEGDRKSFRTESTISKINMNIFHKTTNNINIFKGKDEL